MSRDLNKRLEKLEKQADSKRHARPEAQEGEQWLVRASIRRREELKERDADHAHSLIGLFRVQDTLPGMGVDELIERILSWRPMPAGGRSRGTVEREVGLAIHRGETGTEGMACPPTWRESFAAGDELRERYEAVPDEVLAEGYLRLARIEEEGGDEEELEKWTARYGEGFGITAELLEKAVGPDFAETTKEERDKRIIGYLADVFFGEKGYRVSRHMEQVRARSERSERRDRELLARNRGEGGRYGPMHPH